MALQQLVVQIQGLSAENDLDQLLTALKAPTAEAVLKQNAASLLDGLTSLNYEAHSLGCLFLLEARGRYSATVATQVGQLDFFTETCRFLLSCTPSQIQKCPSKFTSLCRYLKTQAKLLNKAKHALLPLCTAIEKLTVGVGDGLLTPIHADFFELCLLTKCYSTAAALLEHDVTSVDPSKTACTATDVLLYCYYGGMIETGLRNYSHALELYSMALTAPTLVLNAITVAALKRYILVSILYTGQMIPLPRHCAQTVVRALKSECGPYTELAKLYASQDKTVDDMTQYALSKEVAFVTDGNAGLVKLILQEARFKRKILRLTETYITLSLTELARQVGFENSQEAEKALLTMVASGQVRARISESKEMVEFLDDTATSQQAEEYYTSEATVQKIDRLIKSAHALAVELEAVDHAVSMDRAFIGKTSYKGGGGGFDEMKLKMTASEPQDFPMMDE